MRNIKIKLEADLELDGQWASNHTIEELMEFIRNKIVNRVRQYGYRSAFAQISRAALRRVYQVDRDIVFVIPDFDVYAFCDPCIIPLTPERIQQAADAGELNTDEAQLLSDFLAERCRGVCAEIDGKLAGYGLVQFEGEYRFGRTGRMIIPPNHVIVKNLLVFPDYRGHKLGQKLTEALLALIPSGCLPERRIAEGSQIRFIQKDFAGIPVCHFPGFDHGSLYHPQADSFHETHRPGIQQGTCPSHGSHGYEQELSDATGIQGKNAAKSQH